MSLVAPPRVRRGQVVGVCAPAGPVNTERLQRGLDRLAQTFELRVADGIYAERAPAVPAYLAASDAARAAELNAMLADPDVRAIVIARGGYGIMRILDELDGSALVKDPKPIVGFSDATALLAWAYHLGVRAIHGPTATQLGDVTDADLAQLVALLTDPQPPGARAWQLAAHGSGAYEGPLVPANLTLASMLQGTPWPVPLAGAIALFEEVGERPYEIDRYLTQLTLTGGLAAVRAVIVGDLEKCAGGEGDDPEVALRTIVERVHAFGLPAASGAPVGHGMRNEPLPFAARCELDLDNRTIAITEGAVS